MNLWASFKVLCWKISKETQTLNNTMDQLDVIDIYMTFHPKTMNFTFFSSAHGTYSRIYHILGHKSSLGKFKKTEYCFWLAFKNLIILLSFLLALPFLNPTGFRLPCFHFHLFLCIFWFPFLFLLWFLGYSEACCLASICLYF